MYIEPGQGQTIPRDKIFMSTETSCHFGHLLQVSKKSLWSLILYIFFHDFIHVYSPGAGADNPKGWNFDVNRNILSLRSFVASFKKISLKSWFYTIFFNDLIHVYSPRTGADSPQGAKVWCQQKGLITLPICCKFQRNLFQVWFNTISFMI